MSLGLGMAFSAFGGIAGASAASSKERKARREKKRLQRKLEMLEQNRQEIINPYGGAENLSSIAFDLSSMITNPFTNLGVATKAAEIQIEQTDIALANTLDTIRATGGGAGGATALAQAALQSKKGVAASIESQEAQNEKMRAQGEQAMQQAQMAEQRRLQGIKIGEGQRMQGLDAAGKQFMFNQQEIREMQEIDRTASLLGMATTSQAQASADKTSALTGMFGNLAQFAGGF